MWRLDQSPADPGASSFWPFIAPSGLLAILLPILPIPADWEGRAELFRWLPLILGAINIITVEVLEHMPHSCVPLVEEPSASSHPLLLAHTAGPRSHCSRGTRSEGSGMTLSPVEALVGSDWDPRTREFFPGELPLRGLKRPLGAVPDNSVSPPYAGPGNVHDGADPETTEPGSRRPSA